MNIQKRKLLTIIIEAAVENLIIEDFKRLGVKGYTIIDARGKGSRGIRRAEWEQSRNIRIDVIVKQNMADDIFQHLVDNYDKDYAMIVYLSEVEVIRSEKF